MRRLMNAVMLHCRKATYLIEKSNDAPLNFIEKSQLNMHLSMCSGCRNYRKQNRFLERLLKRYAQAVISTPYNTKDLEATILEEIEKKK